MFDVQCSFPIDCVARLQTSLRIVCVWGERIRMKLDCDRSGKRPDQGRGCGPDVVIGQSHDFWITALAARHRNNNMSVISRALVLLWTSWRLVSSRLMSDPHYSRPNRSSPIIVKSIVIVARSIVVVDQNRWQIATASIIAHVQCTSYIIVLWW